MSNAPGLSYRSDIDGLRAVAVVPVVLHHAGIAGVPGGFVGVDVFFVISGFLITKILAREILENRFSLISFYERRARRILPALFVMLAACLVVGWFLLLPGQYEDLAQSTVATLLFVSNVWFWLADGDYFGKGVELAPLLHTWSLAVEEQFYLFFPLLLWGLAKLRRRVWITVIALISCVSLIASIWATQAMPVANFYLAPTRIWELGIGALLAIGAFPTLRQRFEFEVFGGVGLVLIIGSIILLSDETPFPGLTAVPPCLGAAFLIWAGMHGTSLAGKALSLPPMVWVGKISYSLYLWHWPILVAARLQHGSADLPMATALACVLLSVLLATLSLHFVERPFRKPAAKGGFSRPEIFTGAGVGMAFLMAAALVLFVKDGMPGRIPADLAEEMRKFEKPHHLMNACRGWQSEKEPCKIGIASGESAGNDVVVWGDSHAGALLPGVDAWLKANNMAGKAFVKPGCPPLLGVWRVDMASDHGCDTYNEMVAEYIEELSDVGVVIVAARWALATEGTRAQGEKGKPAILAASGERSTGIADNPKHVERGLHRLLDRFRNQGIRVLLVGGIPEIGFNVPQAIAGSIAFGTELRAPPTREEFDHRNARAHAILSAVSRDLGAIFVQPADLLCDVSCRIQLDGQPLYQDDDHLSEIGANWMIPILMDQYSRQLQ